MSDYAFYAAMLRFVEDKLRHSETAEADPRTGALSDILAAVADTITAVGRLRVAPDRLETTARAFAGFAAFLQRQILPEAVAHAHAEAERQVRWAVDAAMGAVNTLLARAALAEGQEVVIDLPPPP